MVPDIYWAGGRRSGWVTIGIGCGGHDSSFAWPPDDLVAVYMYIVHVTRKNTMVF